jgi:hypothetical protein
MAQKTDLNISPYYDDFDSEKNFYKVLFKPGYPIQARELTTLQSILQDQVKSFGSNIFKEGSVVIPGNIAYDGNFNSVKLNSTNFGVDISLYINNFIGKKITGQISGTTAIIQFVSLPDGGNVEDLTIYVKYLDSDNNFQFNPFEDGESLIAEENITYGNTTINAGTPFASLIALNATSVGSSASIGDGVYFIRGYFVNVSKQTIILDNYTNTPSYRVGLKIDELILSSGDDSSLYDPSKGFTNYAAPGADRFKINLTLTKKLISDLNDTDFVELLRVENGKIKIIEQKSQYNTIKDYMAERTYDESGDYTVEPFNVSVNNSLNDRLGNNGLFFNTETTEQKNSPSEDLMCLKISPGKAYVRGYDVEKISTTIIDVPKPRDTAQVGNVNVPFEMGNIIKVNTVSGTPKQKFTIDLLDQFVGSGTTIGNARVYNFSLTDAAYSNNATNWNLYLYDIQTYTTLVLNTSVTSAELPATSFVKGKSSGASGFAVAAGGASSTINLRQTSGTFSVGEQLIINGLDFPRTIKTVTAYSAEDIKSVKQSASTGFSQFTANCFLERFRLPNGIIGGTITGGNTLFSPGKIFTGVKVGSIIRYTSAISQNSLSIALRDGEIVGIGTNLTTTEIFNRVVAVSADGTSLSISSIPSVPGVFSGNVTNGNFSDIFIGAASIKNEESGFLYAQLPDPNVSSVNLSDSLLTISEQITGQSTSNSGVLTLNSSQITGVSSAFFTSFDQERYSVHYNNGGIGTITSDQFVLSGNTVTISGLRPNEINTVVVNTTLVKNGIQSKVKTYNKSQTLNVIRSKNPQSGSGISSSIGDGLTYNQFYGLRVQDEEISLNYPDVAKIISIYESFDSSAPTLDQIQFGASANVTTNAIIGENILGNISKCIARVVSKPSTNVLGIVYLNSERFTNSETVIFEDSNITTEIEVITPGKYKDITNSYRLDKGQKDQYYDYSKIVRNKNTTEPSKQLLVIFDYYSIPSNDSGDVFTVLSYDKDRFTHDVPFIGPRSVRSSDTLDFRPRVPIFTSNSSSPFDFASRTLEPTRILSPNESSLLGYDYYLARIDKLYLDRNKNFILEKGISSNTPKAPDKNDAVMEIATIKLPPYLYNPANAIVTLMDNRRYTMRDIGLIEDRVENLERVTSLSLLEVNTQTLQIQDADGNNRFKSGFFVDDFKNYSFINRGLSSIRVNESTNEITPVTSRNSLKSQIAPESTITDENLDFSENFKLLDPNVVKTGKAVTLKYESIGWIEQAFATTVENVNPFNVIVYSGDIKLSPEIDNWVRTVQLPDKNISITLNSSRTLTNNLTSNVSVTLTPINTQTSETIRLPNIRGEGNRTETNTTTSLTSSTAVNTTSSIATTENFDTVSNTDTTIRNVLISSSSESFMRSRNIQFSVSNIKPSTQFYQFLDGNSGVDFIPKLIEISNPSKAFVVGETVIGTFGGANLISFRVATPNHKYGAYNAPSTTYTINPYIRTESIASGYSQSSKVLNVDTVSLSEEAQGKYSGYLLRGMQLVGQTSGAVTTVSDLRLISDNFGDLIGTFFLRDPNTIPTPTVRIATGTKTFKLTSSSSNDPGLPGSSDTSVAETNFNSDGTLEQWENTVTATTKNLTTKTVTNLTTNTTSSQTTINTHTRTTIQRFVDPLAQSFVVAGNIEAPDSSREGLATDDSNGVFLTAVDLFFAKKDSGNAPVKVEIRTVELSTPTRVVIGNSVTLRPSEVNISTDASIATKVTFDEPIYLPPGREYAIVIISENSDQYEMWTAIMDEKTVNTKDLPYVNAVTYSKQFAMGSLFKSQNGSIWTANQNQDLKFKLYKAEFIKNQPGTAFFYNPTLDSSNGYVQKLANNPLTTLPRTGSLGITTTTNSSLIADLSKGRKIADITKNYVYGYIVGAGSSVATVGLTTGGSNYTTTATPVNTFNIIGNGSGLVLNITATAGAITGITTVNPGNGYKEGDVVGIVTSTVLGSTGRDARITISSITGVDTLYLENIQGNSFTSTPGSQFGYYNNSNVLVSLASTTIRNFTPSTNQYSGNYLRVEHFDHGMYGNTNKLRIYDAESSTAPVVITSSLISTSTTIAVAVGDTSNFATFEGVSVSGSNPGYVKIENEIIRYESIGSGFLGTITRGIDSTISIDHDVTSLMYKYELNGVSLRRINKTHDISDLDIGLDEYYLEIDRTTNGVNRSADGSPAGMPQMQFTSESTLGGSKVLASENILYSSIVPTYDLITPGSSTSVSAFIRTVSGTSVSGNETSFLSNQIEPIQLNALNTLRSVRLVCSKENETEYLNNLDRNKSFTTGITLSTTDSNLSPIIFLDTAFTEFISNRLNSPVSDYALDGRSNSILDDPHAAVYVSRAVKLVNPATSLKVILSAYRHESADFRVLYSLFRPDSSEVEQSFELFPGYDNLTSTTSGLSVVDPSLNNGKPDSFVSSSLDNQFKEYEFTANNLGLFNGYVIKIVMSGTNQAYPPRIKELRTIAVR